MAEPTKGREVFPPSTCTECGLRMAPGRIRRCEAGGDCSWYVPRALRSALEAERAASWELLEALRGALLVIGDCASDAYGTPTGNYFAEECAKIRAVIAKETGGTQ